MSRVDLSGRLYVAVPAPILVREVMPFSITPWNSGNVTEAMVQRAIREDRLSGDNSCWYVDIGDYVPASHHAERIAYLVVHDWPDWPIAGRIEVDWKGEVSLLDGNHRVHALALKKETGDVVVELSGFLDVAEQVFGITIPDNEPSW